MRVNYLISTLMMLFSLHVTAQQIVPGNTMGYTKGIASVSDIGAAQYQVAITCAPGLGGVQPHLGIAYSSQGGNGPLGLSFSIQGLSVISRTSRTWEQDGRIAVTAQNPNNATPSLENNINFNLTDRYSLDGEQLRLAYDTVPVASTPFRTYGFPNSIYYTEQNSFNKIVLKDTLNGSPTYFKIFTKDGLIKEYGNTIDSKVLLSSNNQPLHWLLNKVSDRNGNFIKYSYYNNLQTGQYLPSKIEYSGNVNTNRIASDSIVFIYENTQDSIIRYFKGSEMLSGNRRLTNILCYSKDSIIRKYNFSYYQNDSKTITYLSSIQECGTNNNCLTPTGFAWHYDGFSYSKSSYSNQSDVATLAYSNTKQYLTADFDGDGITDIMTFTPVDGKTDILLSRPGVTNDRLSYLKKSNLVNPGSIINYKLQLIDLNGDGRSDLFFYSQQTGGLLFYLTDFKNNDLNLVQQNYTNTSLSYLIRSSLRNIIVSDYNNDGLSDIIITKSITDSTDMSTGIDPLDYNVFLSNTYSNRNKSIASSSLNLGTVDFDNYYQYGIPVTPPVTGKWHLLFADFDNNSYPDLFLYNRATRSSLISYNITQTNYVANQQHDSLVKKVIAPIYINPSNALDSGLIAHMSIYTTLYAKDINADGLNDIVLFDSTGKLEIWLNRGDFNFRLWQKGTNLSSQVSSGGFKKIDFKDFNNDGLPDICLYGNTAHSYKVFLNKGSVKGFDLGYVQIDPTFYNPDRITLNGQFSRIAVDNYIVFDPVNGSNDYWSSTEQRLAQHTLDYIENGNYGYSFDYSNLRDTSVYKRKVNYTTYPNTEFQNSYPVVTLLNMHDAPTGIPRSLTTYKYESAITNLLGRGFRGFQVRYETKYSSPQVGVPIPDFVTAKYFFKDTSSNIYTGDPVNKVIVSQTNGNLVSQSNYKLAYKYYPRNVFGMSFYTYTSENVSQNFEPNGIRSNTTRTRQEVDDYGNVTTMVVDYGNGYVDSTLNTYSNDTANWILGRLLQAKVYRIAPDKPLLVRNATFEYDSLGRLTKETAFAELSQQLQITKRYVYDLYGNIIQSSQTAWDGSAYRTRTNTTVFDSTGKYIIQLINPLGQSSHSRYNPYTGKLIESKDPNGISTKYEYDDFSRLKKTLLPDGNWQSIDYKLYNSNISSVFPVDSFSIMYSQYPVVFCWYVLYKQYSNQPPVIEYYDCFDRQIGMEKTGFNGVHLTTETYMDYDGKILRQSLWHYAAEVAKYTYYYYDSYGRLTSQVRPGNKVETIAYAPNKKTITNSNNQKKTLIYDEKGQLAQSLDNMNRSISYDYDAAGNMLSTTDPNGNQIVNQFDLRGNKLSVKDPDIGTYNYEYNGFGEVVKQTDGNGNVLTNIYDLLGRLTKSSQSEGDVNIVYDQGSGGIGKISTINSFNNTIETYTYDTIARPISVSKTINGKQFSSYIRYDSYGRVLETTYPNGFKLKQVYNAYGYPNEVRRVADNYLYWRANSLNAIGQVTQQEQANNVFTQFFYNANTYYLDSTRSSNASSFFNRFQYQYDNFGNLLSRRNVSINRTEYFQYDSLNRLTKSYIPSIDTTTLSYDILGNINSKSDVGTYEYGVANDGPHRLTKVNLFQGGCIPSFQISEEYTSFNKVKKIYNDTSSLEIYYGPDLQRNYAKFYVRGVLKRVKYYFNDIFESEEENGVTTETSYVNGGGAIIASYIVKNNVGKSYYWFKDHLGSVTAITDSIGVVLQTFSYDPWGRRRKPDWTKMSDSLLSTFAFQKGFTEQEHYDLFSLVDMNGRIYDPILGRFLSPDPFITDYTNLQNLNRYAYVLNNPLHYTDPTGYSFWSVITSPFRAVASVVSNVGSAIGSAAASAGNWVKDNWKTLVVVTVAVAATIASAGTAAAVMGALGATSGTFAAGVGAAILSGAAAGFASSVTGSLLNGTNLGDALVGAWKGAAIGAVSAGLSYGVGSAAGAVSDNAYNIGRTGIKIVGHGVVQGEITELNGGKFLHGFYAGAISGGTEDGILNYANTNVEKILASAAVGGTTSQVSGGSFVNGAVTGAYVMMFNGLAHEEQERKMADAEKINELKEFVEDFVKSPFEATGAVFENEHFEIFNKYGLGIMQGGLDVAHSISQFNAGDFYGGAGTLIKCASGIAIGVAVAEIGSVGIMAFGISTTSSIIVGKIIDTSLEYIKSHPGSNSFSNK